MRAIILPAFALALGAGFFSAPEAQARFNGGPLAAPSLVEDAQCVQRRIREVRPNGRVVYRTVTDCGVRARPRYRGRCRTVRERGVRPNGRVVYREIRRCR